MKLTARQLSHAASLAVVCASLSLFVVARARAQSTDLGSPTPVYGPEIGGRIAPLDVGDPRQTRHFYTFNARPGDLELTVEANNLDGEIDLFTAAAMRPLAQVTLYSGLGSTVARTVFFRTDSTVILRVQARSPNDADGTYRIRLGGTFAPSTLPPPAESASGAATPARERPADKGARRVNSIGARVEEPKVETPAEPAATERAETTAAPSEATTTPTPATTAKTPPARNSASNRTTPARRGAARRGTAPRTTATTGDAAKTEAAKTEPGNTETKAETTSPTATGEPAPATTNTSRARANRTRGARTNAGAASRSTSANSSESSGGSASSANESPSPASAAPPATGTAGLEAPGARVVLEMRDGTRVERAMSEVRRVAVEGRLVVIVFKDGRVERHPLWNVQRMSIEP